MSNNSTCGSTLYGVWGSPNVQRVTFAVFLKEANINFQIVSFTNGEMKTPEFVAKSLFGQVPLLEDKETQINLTESRAIARYVNDRYNSGVNLSADDNLISRALFEQWISIETTQITPELFKIGYQRFFVPFFLKGTPDENIIKDAVEKVNPLLDGLEKQLQNKDFVLGNRITLVDVFLAPFVNNISNMPEKYLIEKRPNISKWWARVSSLPAWKKVLELAKERKQ